MDGSTEPKASPQDEKLAVMNDATHMRDSSDATVIHREPTDDGIPKRDAEPKNDAESINTSAVAQDTTVQVLEFFANAPDGVLVAIALAFASLLYAIFGQIGLLGIGITAGVLLHAHWVGLHGENEVGTVQLEKALEAKGAQKIKSMLDVEEEKADKQEIGFKDFKPETAKALDEIVARTIEDYVRCWYSPIHPGEESVPRSAKATLVQFIRSVSRTLSKKRPADAFILFLTNTSSIVTTFFGELGNAIKESQEIDVAAVDAVRLYLSAHPESTLSYLLDEKQQHTRFLRQADEMLRHHIDKSVYNCNFAKTFLQQTLCWDIFETTLKTISKPEWFNGWIVYLLEMGEPDLLQAIDAGMSNESKAAMKPKKDSKESSNEEIMSRAVDDQAMEEARRLSELMAEEDMRRAREADVSPPILEEPVSAPAPAQQQAVEETTTPTLPLRPETEVSHSKNESTSTFTSFDQLPTPKVITEEPAEMPLSTPAPAIPALTLHNANITILDDSMPGDKNRTLRSKPSDDYLVQIEPQDSRHPGWMIVRRYDDFETLHEVLKRIAQVSGAANFTKNNANLPTWKGETKPGLRIGLENYLMSACTYRPLAESEGLKRFLEKEHQGPPGKGSPGIGWPTPQVFENMGKGLVDNLITVNKGAADGAKTVFGGMAGVFTGNRNRSESKARKTSVSTTSLPLQLDGANDSSMSPARTSSVGTLNGRERSDSKSSLRPSIMSRSSTSLPGLVEEDPAKNELAFSSNRDSTFLGTAANGTSAVSLQNAVESMMGSPIDTQTSRDSLQVDNNSLATSSLRTSISDNPSNRKASTGDAAQDAALDIESLHLPPPPSDMPDDYLGGDGAAEVTSADTLSSTTSAPALAPPKLKLERKEPEPLTETETRDALELIFAMISSLYTLSSAWGLRLTLLTAAKTFLLRPGNPSLSYIQKLIQDDVISANCSDSGIAAHLKKIRQNSLPTAEELKAWPAEMTGAEKNELRSKARTLLLARGVPAALTGVMGSPATSQALGRVFDSLQDERVLRGLMFGVLMQGVSLVSH